MSARGFHAKINGGLRKFRPWCMQCPKGRIAAIGGIEHDVNGKINGYWCTRGTKTRNWDRWSRTSTIRIWMPDYTFDPENCIWPDIAKNLEMEYETNRSERSCREFKHRAIPTIDQALGIEA